MRKADLISGVEQVSRALTESGLELPLVEVARLGYRREPVPGELAHAPAERPARLRLAGPHALPAPSASFPSS